MLDRSCSVATAERCAAARPRIDRWRHDERFAKGRTRLLHGLFGPSSHVSRNATFAKKCCSSFSENECDNSRLIRFKFVVVREAWYMLVRALWWTWEELLPDLFEYSGWSRSFVFLGCFWFKIGIFLPVKWPRLATPWSHLSCRIENPGQEIPRIEHFWQWGMVRSHLMRRLIQQRQSVSH